MKILSPFDSKPSRPVKEGVSFNRSIIFAVEVDGIFGAGPPPVFFCSLASSVNSLLACECRLFHFSRTSAVVLTVTPTAFTASAIFCQISFFFWLVTLFVSLLCHIVRFSSTFSVKTAISDGLKFCFLCFRELAGEDILVLATCSPWQPYTKRVLWVSNLRLAASNTRLTNRLFKHALSNAILTTS